MKFRHQNAVHPLLTLIGKTDINDKKNKYRIIQSLSNSIFQKHKIRNWVYTLLSFGIFSMKLQNKARLEIINAYAARKLTHLHLLRHFIESTRKDTIAEDPKYMVNTIYTQVREEKIQIDDEEIPLKNIYYASEIFLFITNPLKEKRSLSITYRNSLNAWKALKKIPKANQHYQIGIINKCNKILCNKYHLSNSDINDRVFRTKVVSQQAHLLSRFRMLSLAFEEVVCSYQELEEYEESNPLFGKMIKRLSKCSFEDIQLLIEYLSSKELPISLTPEKRRLLILFTKEQDNLYSLSMEDLESFGPLCLKEEQWKFLSLLKESDRITPKLIRWAFSETFCEVEKQTSFAEELKEHAKEKAVDTSELGEIFLEKLATDPIFNEMTLSFAKELHQKWAPIKLIENQEEFFSFPEKDNLSLEDLFLIYRKLHQFSHDDQVLFEILQEAIAQSKKNAFQSQIEAGIDHMLGDISTFMVPTLLIAQITLIRKSNVSIEIQYCFKQTLHLQDSSNPMNLDEENTIIFQKIVKKDGTWISHELTSVQSNSCDNLEDMI